MPAGRGSRCEACYWNALLQKRIAINSAAFVVPTMAAHFLEFGTWLGSHAGTSNAAITLHRYLPFFLEIEKRWARIPEYRTLLAEFGAQGLRKVLLPMQWMKECCGVQVDLEEKSRDTEQRRIDAMLTKLPSGSPESVLLRSYGDYLQGRYCAGESGIRAVRLALSPALALIEKTLSLKVFPPGQQEVHAYLKDVPGQRAAVTGFVNFLRERCGLAVAMPKFSASSLEQARKRRLEKHLRLLLARYGESVEFQQAWIKWALEYFHRVKISAKLGVEFASAISFDDEGATVEVRERRYWIPRWKRVIETT